MVEAKGASEKDTELSENYLETREGCLKFFDSWTENEQVDFVETLLSHMCHYQHGQINTYLKPMLQRDFISALPGITFFMTQSMIVLFYIH